MADIIVAGNTSGAITISAPLVAGSGTLTLPVATDTLVGKATTDTLTNKSIAATQLTGTIAAARLPAGSVLQVVNATYSTQSSTSSTSFVDTNLTATITPSSASSKILVFVSQTGTYKSVVNTHIKLNLLRGASIIVNIEIEHISTGVTQQTSAATSTTYLDSPATTSATTYKTQIASGGAAGAVYWNVSSCTSTITLMEIAG